MNRRQLLGATFAAAVGAWVPWRLPARLPPAAPVNLNDALVPEEWARQSLAILEENMVVALLIHRDFPDDQANRPHPRLQSFGHLAQGAS